MRERAFTAREAASRVRNRERAARRHQQLSRKQLGQHPE